MKAAVIYSYGPPNQLKIIDLPIPTILHPKDVVVKVHYSCVNPVDCKIRQGNHKLWLRLKTPITLGFDFSGEIVQIGNEVKDFKVGDFVFGLGSYIPGGAYAEYVRTRSEQLCKTNDSSLMEKAAIAMAGGTALVALRKAKASNGKKVLINGAGSGVGHMAMQMAINMGAEVYAACSARHVEILEFVKPYRHIDNQEEDFREVGISFDIIFDVTGTAPYPSVVNCLAKGGVYINILPRPSVLLNKLKALLHGHKVLSFLFRPKREILSRLDEMLQHKEVKVFIDSKFPLEEIVEAHRRSESHQASGKIVLIIAS